MLKDDLGKTKKISFPIYDIYLSVYLFVSPVVETKLSGIHAKHYNSNLLQKRYSSIPLIKYKKFKLTASKIYKHYKKTTKYFTT